MELAGRTLLGKYRIEGLLGQGGMGSVWKGSHVVTGRKIAIKVLDERFLSNVNVVQRFGREARAASAIQHEGIVEVLDLDQTEEGLPFLVMEHLEGETLSKRIERKGRLSQEEAARIGTLLLEALAAAHEHGVIHRDLKPDNIFLVPAGRRGEVVKILDFGISHKDDEAQAKLTMTGSVLGTPHYMSPEQAMGETNLDRRVDIYGVGVVLYECVVGDVPFDAPNYNKLLRVILDDDAVPPTKRGAMIEPRFERVILSAIDKERDRRPQTARDLLAELKAATSDETERFGPEMVARLNAAGVQTDRKRASASFARPKDASSASSSGMPAIAPGVPMSAVQVGGDPVGGGPVGGAPQASGVRGRGGALAETRAAAVNDDLEFDPLAELGDLAQGSLDAPRIAPAASTGRAQALRLDAPSGGGGFSSMDELDALAPGGGLALEIDESALARPSRAPDAPQGLSASSTSSSGTFSSASSSGRHRAVDARASISGPHRALSDVPRTTPSRSTPARTTPARSAPVEAAAPASRSGAPEAMPDAPRARTLRDRWDDLPEGARRWLPIALAGLVVFVAVVSLVRYVVRSDADEIAGDVVIDPIAGSPDPARPEWVLIHVDGVPPGARLRLDGLPGATLPLRVRRGGSHVLVIQAPGYQERRLVFDAEGNDRLRADMRPEIGTSQGI